MRTEHRTIALSLADGRDRESIYAIRHQVYAGELGQHAENGQGRLTDTLDAVNTYIVAKVAGGIAGFISITPPGPAGYSIDKYFARADVPLVFDEGLYEVRLLTVTGAHRGTHLALLLMYGALRYVESLGGSTVVAIGRLEVLELYKRAGLTSLRLCTKSGRATYELMAADVGELQARLPDFEGALSRLERTVDWRLGGLPFRRGDGCYHGGAFFEAIGEEFEALERKDDIINADVLDAWFDPAPSVVDKLARHLPFALKTSPPTGCDGMRRAIARARGVPAGSILPGAGSSDLIFAGLRYWVTPASRVLILDPMYGEYAHVLENVIGARVDRLTLSRGRHYDVDVDELAAQAARGYDWVVLVNPNSPTGRHIPRRRLEPALSAAPRSTRWWIDETYADYAGAGESLEALASSSANVVICKSMSKVYALSGARAAYLCGPTLLMDELKRLCPPWWLRRELAVGLRALGWDVVPGCANFLLCHLPASQPEAPALAARCRARNLFVRDVSNMGRCFDARTLRLAVKDRKTNLAMLTILRITLAEMAEAAGRAAA